MTIIVIIINIIIIIIYSWLPVFEKHLQKAYHDGVIHRGNGFYCGTLHIKKNIESKDKKHLFTKMSRSGEQRKQQLLQKTQTNITPKQNQKRHSYCTYKTESAPLSIHLFTTHTKNTQGLLCWLYFFLEASYLNKLVQYIKQINTYIYSTYIENEG